MKRLSVEDKISRAVSNVGELNAMAKRVEMIIQENLEEALISKNEFIKNKATKLKEQIG